MKRLNPFIFLILWLSILPVGLSGQSSTLINQSSTHDTVRKAEQISALGQLTGSIEDYVRLNKTPPREKIYLHVDRSDYMQGDTIWFKAYSWFGYDQIPDSISGILHIDLINSNGKVAAKRKLLIQKGTSNGDFCLDTTINPGKYTIRAYTKWMQNLNTGDPFYQTVVISPPNQNFHVECVPVIKKQAGNDSLLVRFRFFEIDQRGDLKNTLTHKVLYSLKVGDRPAQTNNILASNAKEQEFKYNLSGKNENDSLAIFKISIQDNSVTFEKQFQIPLRDDIDLQFFPEGGNLVNGLESKVAFKAIGTDGLSREVKGEIKESEENVVTNFESTHKGMGTFVLKPDSRKKYFADLWFNNRKYIIPLPNSSEEGFVMSVSSTENGNDLFLTIKCNPIETNNQKYIVGNSNGKIWFSALIKMIKDSCRIHIPLELLPEGICRLTILNSDFKPECERLIYVDKNQRFKIEVKPDSSSYSTRSKVVLQIKTTGTNGVPVQTDLSLAVIDQEQVRKDGDINGISTYKLLESELQGYIEDPNSYFKNDSISNRKALDLLLLTHGYRKFLSKNINAVDQKYQPERNFDISGTIKFGGSKSREKKFNYKDIDLTLLSRSSKVLLAQSNPDSLGKFSFQIPLLFGKSPSLLQATTKKGKPLFGEIFLDENIMPPRFTRLESKDYGITLLSLENVRQLQAVTKTLISKNPAYGAMSLNLPEVTVKASAKNWYRDFEHNAKKIADLDSLDPEGKKYETIYDLLIREFGAKQVYITRGIKTITLPCVSVLGPDDWFPIYLINGKPYFNGAEHGEMFLGWLEYISTINVNEISKLMVLPPGNIPSHYADPGLNMYIRQSLVVIETYSDNSFRGDPQGIKTFILDGLDAPRVFYSPRYEGLTKKSPIYDGRVTLYWEPSLMTDDNGQAKIEFFTSDRQTVLNIIVNGMELINGATGQGKTQINSTLKK